MFPFLLILGVRCLLVCMHVQILHRVKAKKIDLGLGFKENKKWFPTSAVFISCDKYEQLTNSENDLVVYLA